MPLAKPEFASLGIMSVKRGIPPLILGSTKLTQAKRVATSVRLFLNPDYANLGSCAKDRADNAANLIGIFDKRLCLNDRTGIDQI
jgi:hypothetical protein